MGTVTTVVDSTLETALGGLPKSCRRVARVLTERGPLTHKALGEHAGISGRTIRYALARLLREGIVAKRTSFRDTRQDYYFIARNGKAGAPQEATAGAGRTGR